MGRLSEFAAEGLGYRCTFPDLGTSFHVDRLRVTSGEVKGHVMVRTAMHGARTYRDGLVHYSQENLSSSTARKSMGKLLGEKIPTEPAIDWFGLYDEFCTLVMLADREGSEPDIVGNLPGTAVNRMLLQPLVPMGVQSILFGDGGLGKSAIATGVAVSLQTGKEIIPGFHPQEQGAVLYLNWETTKEDIDSRVKAVCKGAGIKPVEMLHVPGQGRPLYQRVEYLSRVIGQQGVVMLIIDSSGKAIGTSGEGPIEDSANRFASALDELGRTALCIDHVSKAAAGQQGGAGKPYGSTMKSNWARASWELTAACPPSEDGTSHLVLHHRKHNTTAEHAPIGLSMHWQDGAVTWSSEDVDDSALAYGATMLDRIAAVLADHPLRVNEIAPRVGSTDEKVRAMLNKYKDRFAKIDTGDWSLTETA